jgi:hypothetical protein
MPSSCQIWIQWNGAGLRSVLAPLMQGSPVSRDYRGTANLAVSVRLSRLSLLRSPRKWPERIDPSERCVSDKSVLGLPCNGEATNLFIGV